MTATLTPETSPMLTMAEIEERYDGEWVLILEPQADEYNNVTAGRVVAHNKFREAVVASEFWMRPGSAACLYIGKIPDDVWYML